MTTPETSHAGQPRGRLYAPAQAGEYLGGLAPQTLARWRCEGCGPAYFRIGGRIFYAENDLDDFLAARRRLSTSEAA